jgi:hypothetical protein
MSPAGFAVLLAVAALAVWLLGGVVLRVGGWIVMIVGVVGLMSGQGLAAVGFLLLGCVMWLVGHLHYALRHGAYKSPLAGRVIGRPRKS